MPFARRHRPNQADHSPQATGALRFPVNLPDSTWVEVASAPTGDENGAGRGSGEAVEARNRGRRTCQTAPVRYLADQKPARSHIFQMLMQRTRCAGVVAIGRVRTAWSSPGKGRSGCHRTGPRWLSVTAREPRPQRKRAGDPAAVWFVAEGCLADRPRGSHGYQFRGAAIPWLAVWEGGRWTWPFRATAT